MNDYGRRWMLEQMGSRDNRRGDMRADRERDNRDYENDYEPDYYDRLDERRGGRRRNRRRRDYEDYEDMSDYHSNKSLRLSKADMHRWKHEMENTDGTKGEHFDMQQVMTAAEKLGIKFDEYTEKEFCLAMNMIYSDYGHIIKKLVGHEKEAVVCADFAKAYFDDPDGPEPEEKLAVHYHCMTNIG